MFWFADLIYKSNNVEMGEEGEVLQIVSALQKSGYIALKYSCSDLVKITVVGKSLIEKNLNKSPKLKLYMNKDIIDIFISHSSQDTDTAKLLIDLIRVALNVPANKIRCTSVEGYRLPAGVSTDFQLKQEVNDCKILIGLISPHSINSAYVLFELGARWGMSKPLIPLVTSKVGTQLLKGPLSGINALNSSVPQQLYQLISDIAKHLNINSATAAVYTDKLDSLVQHSLTEILPEQTPPLDKKEVNFTTEAETELESNQNSINKQIKSYCEKQWPGDFKMQVHCIKEQNIAFEKMKEPKPKDIPENIFNSILQKATIEWPEEYNMQVHSKNEQIEAFRHLQAL